MESSMFAELLIVDEECILWDFPILFYNNLCKSFEQWEGTESYISTLYLLGIFKYKDCLN